MIGEVAIVRGPQNLVTVPSPSSRVSFPVGALMPVCFVLQFSVVEPKVFSLRYVLLPSKGGPHFWDPLWVSDE